MKKEKLDLDDIDFEVCDARVQMGDVEEIWTTLLQKCPHGFYLSWGWVSTWLETVPSDKKIFLITGFIENKPVMSFFLGEDKRIRNKFFLSHSLCLNTTGDPPLDIITVEYNTILIDPRLELNIDRIIGQIPEKGWNELKLPGLSDEFVSRMELLNDKWLNRFNILTEQHHESYFVDLQKIRDNGMDYDKLLSSNRRTKIRKALKELNKFGEVKLRLAENVDEALSMLESLADLHQKRWVEKGEPGSFAYGFFNRFHKALIKNRFGHGEIKVLHIYNAKMTIGYLYFFAYKDSVMFYQSGLNFSTEVTGYSPGLVAHYLAIKYFVQDGFLIYDFLAGDSRYKRSLSTDTTSMTWIRIQQKTHPFFIENRLKSIKKKLSQTVPWIS